MMMMIGTNTPLMHYHFVYVGANLNLTSPQPDTSQHCETVDMGYCIHVKCLFTPQLLLGTPSAYPWRDGSG